MAKAPFRGMKPMRMFIEDLVQATSEAETIGGLIYTLSVLQSMEDERGIPPAMLKQSYVYACFMAAIHPSDEQCYSVCRVSNQRLAEAQSVVARALENSKGWGQMAVGNRLAKVREGMRSKYQQLQDLLGNPPTLTPSSFPPHERERILKAANEVKSAYHVSTRMVSSFSIHSLSNGFTQLINGLARRYITTIMTNLKTHMWKRQKRAIWDAISGKFPERSRSFKKFLRQHALWKLSKTSAASKWKPKVNLYRDKTVRTEGSLIADDLFMQSIIAEHEAYVPYHLDNDDTSGPFTDENVADHPHEWFPYLAFLADQVNKRFQFIPQYTMKVRSIKIGANELAEIMSYISSHRVEYPDIWSDLPFNVNDIPSAKDALRSKISRKEETIEKAAKRIEKLQNKLENATPDSKPEIEKDLSLAKEKHATLIRQLAKLHEDLQKTPKQRSKVSLARWKTKFFALSQHFFPPPSQINPAKERWTGVVTTNGVYCSWHKQKPKSKGKSRKKPKKPPDKPSPRILRSDDLTTPKPSDRPKIHGTHGIDCLVSQESEVNVVAVDPGHELLISAVRQHIFGTYTCSVLPLLPSKLELRRFRLRSKLAERDLSSFTLSNRQWQEWCGRTLNRKREVRLRTKMDMHRVYAHLSRYSSKTSVVSKYKAHVIAVCLTLEPMKLRARVTASRRWAFDAYRKEQLAVKKLSQMLLEGCVGPTVVVWGNGGFGPTSMGHAPAPNKKLRRMLSKYMHIILTSEYGSSQVSGCCLAPMIDRPSRHRVTVKKCVNCIRLLSRDLSAAMVILAIFRWQRRFRTSGLPPFILRRKINRELQNTARPRTFQNPAGHSENFS